MTGSGDSRTPLAGLAAACLLVLALTFAFQPESDAFFARFFGTFDPRLVVLAAGVAGLGALGLLHGQGWIGSGTGRRQAVLVAGLAALFAVPTVLVDILHPFPATMNLAAPQGLLFYPVIAFLVEVLFHLVPLALILPLWRLLTDSTPAPAYWTAALAVAVLEPGFQIAAGTTGDSPLWRDVYLGLHLMAFNLVQLGILRRHGFMPMLGFRLVYYLIWHILWGAVRLPLLFGT